MIPPLGNTPTGGRRPLGNMPGRPFGNPAARGPLVPPVSLRYLRTYAAAGIAVLPLHTVVDGGCSCGRACPTPAKHPRTHNGKDDASTDPEVIREWLARWPRSNWGGRPPVGQVVLDVDPRNDGHEHLAELILEHGPLPATRTQRTGGGGVHYWLELDGPVRGKLTKGLDVKTSTGYVVLAPSVHMSGGRYEFTDRSPVARCPEWLEALLRPPAPRPWTGGGGNVAALVRTVAQAPAGSRNDVLYWAARRCVEQSTDPAILLEAARRCGLADVEANRTIDSARNSASGLR